MPQEINCLEFAKAIVQDLDLITGHDRRLYQYHSINGTWKQIQENRFKQIITEALEEMVEKVSSHMVREVISLCENINLMPEGSDFNQNRSVLVLKNGNYNLVEMEFKPNFSRELYSTVSLNVHYDQNAQCKRWLQFMEEVFPNDLSLVNYFQEMMGYCFTSDTSYQTAFFLLGPGKDGKSVALKIIQHLIGSQNISNIPFHMLENPHYLAGLDGKLLNISSELDGRYGKATSNFKAIVTGDWLEADRKFGHPYRFKPIAKMLGAGNSIPRVQDKSYGLSRRISILPFEVRFDGDREDRGLEEKLLKESDGIFMWALNGLERLKQNNSFTVSESMDIAKTEFEREINPFLTYVEERCTLDPKLRTHKDDLKDDYFKWCENNKYRPFSTNTLTKELKKIGVTIQKSNDTRFYAGITLNKLKYRFSTVANTVLNGATRASSNSNQSEECQGEAA